MKRFIEQVPLADVVDALETKRGFGGLLEIHTQFHLSRRPGTRRLDHHGTRDARTAPEDREAKIDTARARRRALNQELEIETQDLFHQD